MAFPTPQQMLTALLYCLQAAFCQTAAGLPALPDLAHHAPDVPAAASAQPVRLSFSCTSIVGQISTEQITAAELAERHGVAQGLAVCFHDVAVSADSAPSQVRWLELETMGGPWSHAVQVPQMSSVGD